MLLLSLVMLVCASIAFAAEDKAGFRGIEWNAQLDSIKGTFNPVSENNSRKTYTRKGDDMTMYGVKLASIEYTFDKGALCEVMVKAKGEDNWNKLRDGLVADFGRSDSYRIYTIYNRSGGTTIIDAIYDKDSDSAQIKFTAPGYFYGG